MKRISLFFTLLLIPFFAISQNIKIKKGKVIIDKNPYCLYEEESSSILFAKNYTIKSLDGTELFFIKRESVQVGEILRLYVVFRNLQTKEQFEIEEPTTNTLRFIIKHFYNNEVLTDSGINEEGLEKFKLKYADDFKSKYEAEADRAAQAKPNVVIINEGESENYELTERDRSKAISIIGKTIKQDFTVIGTYAKDSEVTEGTIIDIFTIYDVNKRLIARVEKEQFGEVVTYVTMKDNKKKTFTTASKFDSDMIEEVVKILVDYMYL